MPEVLQDAGVYFDPEVPSSIAEAIENLLLDEENNFELAQKAAELANSYSWRRCAGETWNYIKEIYNGNGEKGRFHE